ncbi:MAG: alanine--tRNA ligase [Endomicrobium sp.]|jgi:alanyl-tRNA synthetase|nr:alanine--tRNA ligase [Endomicrobium sp.]
MNTNTTKQSAKIRAEFLRFFKDKGCTSVTSDSLIPSGDKTLLFTSAGMVQFKQHFLGQSKDAFTRAVSCQKCFRTSDIEQVGVTTRHLTFFEMLGNFSFGDYFKKEAIEWAWEFLTKNMSLPKDKLYITVYKDDDETVEIWKKIVREDRIIRMGDKTNFWNMGDTGPCGPCSEILIDLGPEMSCGKPSCGPSCDCDRYLEIWNLVFTQFDRQTDGSLKNLPRKNIDTGMGLERLVAAANGKKSVFETDLFIPIMEEASKILNVKYEGKNIAKLRMIADHARAVTFLISDGILPSNEGRGYVLRRILRRAVRQGRMYGYDKPFINGLASAVFKIMEPAYSELSSKLANIKSIIKVEEEKFLETLEAGSGLLSDMISSYKSKEIKTIKGEDVFKLYDTYGFPHDLTKEIAAENGMSVDEEGFKSEQKKAQDKSRAAWGGSGEKDITFYSVLRKKYGDTLFDGYDNYEFPGKVLALIKDGKEIEELNEGDSGEIILSQTPFYAESGGQSADKGKMMLPSLDAEAEVYDVFKPIGSLFAHKAKVLKGSFRKGLEVLSSIDIRRRKQIQRHHTATHLLHKALKELLGEHIAQAGSLVAPDYLRFDFTHFSAIKKDDLIKIENKINAVIRDDVPVCVESMGINEARNAGAMALFGEKYGDIVRTVSVRNCDEKSNYSMELCGGTHISRTGEIGFFKIISESSVAAGVRRIEAVAGEAAELYVLEEERNIYKTLEMFSASKSDLTLRIQKYFDDYKKLERELESLKSRAISSEIDSMIKEVKDINGVNFLSLNAGGADIKALRDISDKVKAKLGSCIVLAAAENDGKAAFIVSVTEDNVKKGFNAGKIAKAFASDINGSGGGKPDFAQGGTKDFSKLKEALKNSPKYISA